MPQINQLSEVDTLQKGDSLPYIAPNVTTWWQSFLQAPLNALIAYMSQGVSASFGFGRYFSVPGVPFADLPDAPAGARAYITDGAQNNITRSLTVGQGTGTQYGFQVDSFGEMDDTIFYPNGAQIIALFWIDAILADGLYLVLDGHVSNGGWTQIVVNGTGFTRTSASYDYDSGSNISTWNWNPVSNPFGSVGDEEAIIYSFTGFSFNVPVTGGASGNLPVFFDGEIWRAG
jgi:hypothetical protein